MMNTTSTKTTVTLTDEQLSTIKAALDDYTQRLGDSGDQAGAQAADDLYCQIDALSPRCAEAVAA